MKIYDTFISHAWEDKNDFVRPLAKKLLEADLSVWYDEISLRIGDSLSESIDNGLSLSRFGIVVLSKDFFAKKWTRRELDGLVAREMIDGERIILPIWHGVEKEDVLKYSPPLADAVAVNSRAGVDEVARKILERVHDGRHGLSAQFVSAGTKQASFPNASSLNHQREQHSRHRDVSSAVPACTLRLAEKPLGSCWWHLGGNIDRPAMQIAGLVLATNVSSYSIRITKAVLAHGFLGTKREVGVVMVGGDASDSILGTFDIPAGQSRTVSVNFWLLPPVIDANSHFIAHAVILFDQFGNKHVLKRVSFRSRSFDSPKAKKEPEEFLYSIADPVERDVVSFLKVEADHYRRCGRRVGGLGSISVVQGGRTVLGRGAITPPPRPNAGCPAEEATIVSENVEGLVAYYNRISSSADKLRIVAILLERLNPANGYLGISYFIVTVLMRLGFLGEALEKASSALPAGDDRMFGLSNVLMLLSGLLQYCPNYFTESDLERIEKLAVTKDEYCFGIPDKIALIRTQRLNSR
ncbi:MAG TPA: toll/interleukin-1 receptor domain-containing protein [Capsulimonadaceae bacterium]|jgi:hypothetical protein